VYRGFGTAGFGELTLVQRNDAVKIPADTPLDVACVIGCAIRTGVGAVINTARVEEGASVLVLGLGGIGVAVVQGARLAGAALIVASDPAAPRLIALWQRGALDLEGMVSQRRPLAEINAGLDDLRAGRGIRTVLSL
jgi:Zn-dependent alcohol dehydrogenase